MGIRAFFAWVFALLLLVFALLTLAVRVALPSNPEWVNQILSKVHSQRPVDVKVARLELSWRGLNAVVLAQQVTATQGATSLSSERVELQLDLLRSISDRAPRFDQILLIGLDVALPVTGSGRPQDPEKLLELALAPLAMADDIRISRASIQGPGVEVNQLSGRLTTPDGVPQFDFVGQLRTPEVGAAIKGQLRAVGADLEGYVQYGAQGALPDRFGPESWDSEGELWLKLGRELRQVDWRGKVQSQGDTISGAGQWYQPNGQPPLVRLNRMQGQISGHGIKLDEARGRVGDQWDLELTGLQLDGLPRRLLMQLPENLAQRLALISPQIRLSKGYLNSELGYWRLAEGKSLASAGIPGGQFGAASVVTQGKMGVAQIAEITEFHSELHTDAPIDFSQGRGLVAWHPIGDRRWRVEGQGLELGREDLALKGYFTQILSPEPAERRFDLVLSGNSQNRPAAQWVPQRFLGEAGRAWWKTAEPAMVLDELLVWINRSADNYQSVSAVASQAQVTADPKWPRIEAPELNFAWNGRDLRFFASEAMLGALPVQAVEVVKSPEQAWRLEASSQLDGATAFAQLEPLPIQLGDWTQDLALQGDMGVSVDLSLASPVTGQVLLQPLDLALTYRPLDLRAQAVQGELIYDLDQGWVDTKGTASFESRTLNWKLDDGKAFGLEIDGPVELATLTQRYLPVFSDQVTGTVLLNARIDRTWSVQAQVAPDQLLLPEPFAGGGGVRVSGDGPDIHFELDDQVKLTWAEGRLEGRLDQADLAAWVAVIGGGSDVSGSAIELDLQVSDTLLGDVKFGATQLNLQDRLVRIEGPNFQTQIELGDQINVNVDRLVGRTPEAILDADIEPDPDSFQPAPVGLPPMVVSAVNIQIDDQRIDRLDARVFDSSAGLKFEPLTLSVGGAQIDAVALWSNEVAKSSLQADIQFEDLGGLMDGFGLGQPLETRSGQLDLDLSWRGYPWAPRFKAASGDIRLATGQGRLLDSPSSTDALRLLGIFNIQSLTRRLRLDFSDLLQAGLAFDSLEGAARLRQGRVSLVEPLALLGPGGKFYLSGSNDLKTGQLDHRLKVQVPLSAQLPAAALFAGVPAIAAGIVLLLEQAAGDTLSRIGETNYQVGGTFDEPIIEALKPEKK